jgi:hypothetical protein
MGESSIREYYLFVSLMLSTAIVGLASINQRQRLRFFDCNYVKGQAVHDREGGEN